MSLHELAGKPVPREMLVNVPRLVADYYTRRPDPGNPAEGVSFGTSGTPRLLVQGVVQRGARAGHRAGGLRAPGRRGLPRPALSRHGHPRPLRAGVRERARSARRQRRGDDDPGRARLHAHAGRLARHPRLQPRAHGRPRRRDRHHALAQPPRGRRHQVRPAERRPGRHRGHPRHRGAGERAAGREPRRRAPDPVQARAHGLDDARSRLRHAVCRRPGEHRRSRGDRARRPEDRRRPDGRRRHRLLGPDRHDVQPRTRGRQPRRRPDVRLHAARPRRQDPHGLLLAARHGGPDRAQGALRHRLRQRPGLRPPRHRHPQRRPDEPEPLPRRRGLAPLLAPAALAGRGRASARRSSPAR